MLYNDYGSVRPPRILAISQPEHALVSGRILAAWAEPVDERVVLAAAQHDVAWLDWEAAPQFDVETARPREFRSIGAAEHAPMWERGVERALAAWGRRVALMISRHGSTIYQRFSDRHRSPGAISGAASAAEDECAAQDYLERHSLRQEGWARSLGLGLDEIVRDAELIAFVDTLSLVLCGALPLPPLLNFGAAAIALSPHLHLTDTLRLDPWPLAPDALTVEIEARPLPASGRLADDSAMRDWLADSARVSATFYLVGP